MQLTPLCEIAYKYKTDKCPQLWHVYTPFYYQLFKDTRHSIRKVVEMGIGYKRPRRLLERADDYRPGASLRMWRDFFPNAHIYGADISPKAQFEEDGITTILCDETRRDDIMRLIDVTGRDVDIFIDDGLHHYQNQIFLCQEVLPLLKKEVVYIIEDVIHSRRIKNALEPMGFSVEVPELEGRRSHGGKLVLVRK